MSIVQLDKALNLKVTEYEIEQSDGWSVACCGDMAFGLRYKEGKTTLMLRCLKCIPGEVRHITMKSS